MTQTPGSFRSAKDVMPCGIDMNDSVYLSGTIFYLVVVAIHWTAQHNISRNCNPYWSAKCSLLMNMVPFHLGLDGEVSLKEGVILFSESLYAKAVSLKRSVVFVASLIMFMNSNLRLWRTMLVKVADVCYIVTFERAPAFFGSGLTMKMPFWGLFSWNTSVTYTLCYRLGHNLIQITFPSINERLSKILLEGTPGPMNRDSVCSKFLLEQRNMDILTEQWRRSAVTYILSTCFAGCVFSRSYTVHYDPPPALRR